MDDHVVFFFGSGVSLPSGMPSVGGVTQKVLDAPLVYTENKRYVFPNSVEDNPRIGRPRDSSCRHVAKLRGFLGEVRQHAQAVLCEDEEYHQRVTYEDLYALCGEIVSDQKGTKLATDPVYLAGRPFSEVIRNEANGFLLRGDDNPLFHTANEATFLISGVVREMLSDSPDEIQGLDPLLAAIEELDRVTIVTLNHDLLLEQFLKEHDISFDDGFEREKDGMRRYNPERLFDGPNDVTIIKPHGSVNWYIDDSGDQSEYISFPVDEPVPEPTELPRLRPREPRILQGYRKEGQYTVDIFGDMVDALLFALHDASTVIESGFGWTDSGMYNHLRRYLDWSGENNLLLLHQEDDDIFSEPHPFSYFDSSFPGTRPPDGLIRELSKYLSCTCWAEVKDHIE